MTDLINLSLSSVVVIVILGLAVCYLASRFIATLTGKSSCDACCLLSKRTSETDEQERSQQ